MPGECKRYTQTWRESPLTIPRHHPHTQTTGEQIINYNWMSLVRDAPACSRPKHTTVGERERERERERLTHSSFPCSPPHQSLPHTNQIPPQNCGGVGAVWTDEIKAKVPLESFVGIPYNDTRGLFYGHGGCSPCGDPYRGPFPFSQPGCVSASYEQGQVMDMVGFGGLLLRGLTRALSNLSHPLLRLPVASI